MRDVRLLTLYKQHYLDKYNEDSVLKADYSCIGYYDGMNIRKVEPNQNGLLLRKETNTPLS